MRVSILRKKSQNIFSTTALGTFQKPVPAISAAFRRLLLLGSARGHIFISSRCCNAFSFHPRARAPSPHGRLERGASLVAEESLTSTMSVAISLVQMPSRIGGNAATIAISTSQRTFGSATIYLGSVMFGSLVLFIFLLFRADLHRMRTSAYTRL